MVGTAALLRRKQPCIALAAVATLALTGSVQQAVAQDLATALGRAGRAYESLTSLRADFRQTIANPMLGDPETTRGVLFLVPPDRLAMRFEHPAGDRIVVDGEWLWAFTPSTVPDQVLRQPIPQSGSATPNLFLQFVDHPLERYDATYVGVDTVAGDVVDIVRLVPKLDGLGFRRATISIARRTGLLRRVALVEESGQRRTLVFEGLEPGAAVPRREVTFVVPDGVRIVTP